MLNLQKKLALDISAINPLPKQEEYEQINS